MSDGVIINFVKRNQQNDADDLEMFILEKDLLNLDSSVRIMQSDTIDFTEEEIQQRIKGYRGLLILILSCKEATLQLNNNLIKMDNFIDDYPFDNGENLVRYCCNVDNYVMGNTTVRLALLQFEYTRYIRNIVVRH